MVKIIVDYTLCSFLIERYLRGHLGLQCQFQVKGNDARWPSCWVDVTQILRMAVFVVPPQGPLPGLKKPFQV